MVSRAGYDYTACRMWPAGRVFDTCALTDGRGANGDAEEKGHKEVEGNLHMAKLVFA